VWLRGPRYTGTQYYYYDVYNLEPSDRVIFCFFNYVCKLVNLLDLKISCILLFIRMYPSFILGGFDLLFCFGRVTLTARWTGCGRRGRLTNKIMHDMYMQCTKGMKEKRSP